MPLGLRVFVLYGLFVGLSGWFVFDTVMDEIRPGVRQSTEETLVDTANLLAELLREDLAAGRLQQSNLSELLKAYGRRQPNALIWGLQKNQVNHRIYVTDANGIVLLDSRGEAVGQDYSRWNDVYLTLQGRYGARSTADDPADKNSSVMYIGAPIRDQGEIIGVVSVAKPNSTLAPYIERSEQRLAWFAAGLIVLGLSLGAFFAWRLSRSLRQLTEYARGVSAGQRVQVPKMRSPELAQLAGALAKMREELEGKAYVERYVHTLTHELKSPLAAIHAAAELLQEPMELAQQQRFSSNISNESLRMQQLVERLLNLAQVEQRQGLEDVQSLSLLALVEDLLDAQQSRILAAALRVDVLLPAKAKVIGEAFLLRQALANLLENALDFTPAQGLIRFSAKQQGADWLVQIFNQGDGIPDFALHRVCERFYSLPRPSSGRKSTGLGLNFVQEVASLHGGSLELSNVDGGVVVTLRLPAAE